MLIGPLGTGKTMLAQRIVGLLPELSPSEALACRRGRGRVITEPTTAAKEANTWAIIALVTGLISLIIPSAIVLAPIAVTTGVVGEHLARTQNRRGAQIALGGLVLGTLTLYMALSALGILSSTHAAGRP